MPHRIQRAAPILKVFDLAHALTFYADHLGFKVNWEYHADPHSPNPAYASLTLDGIELHLSSFAGDGAYGTAVYFYVADVDALWRTWSQRVPDFRVLGPEDQTWNMRELYLRDPDNNQLRFGCPVKPAVPAPPAG